MRPSAAERPRRETEALPRRRGTGPPEGGVAAPATVVWIHARDARRRPGQCSAGVMSRFEIGGRKRAATSREITGASFRAIQGTRAAMRANPPTDAGCRHPAGAELTPAAGRPMPKRGRRGFLAPLGTTRCPGRRDRQRIRRRVADGARRVRLRPSRPRSKPRRRSRRPLPRREPAKIGSTPSRCRRGS